MKTFFNYIFILCLASVLLFSCNDNNKITGDSIFEDVPVLDSTLSTYNFDLWLYHNYLIPYNIKFDYKMVDVGSDMDYNLVPTENLKAQQLAHLMRYLWFDVYKKVVSDDFLKLYGPRMIHLIGSPAINASLGTIVLGTAEGGIKITLYYVNSLDPTNIPIMNEYYFKTMHHEFAHILHQTKNYPKTYDAISAGHYDMDGWQNRTDEEANSLGFASNYGSSQPREDFVEIIANYIVKTDADWNKTLWNASKEWTQNSNGEAVLTTKQSDGVDGQAIILQKLEICREWLSEKWNIKLDSLRAEVQRRQSNLNMLKVMNDDY
ncbi:MAG: putative zinc-binding metallopeptidase [Paludibacter sp.]